MSSKRLFLKEDVNKEGNNRQLQSKNNINVILYVRNSFVLTNATVIL